MRTVKRVFLFTCIGSIVPTLLSAVAGILSLASLIMPVVLLVGYTISCIPHEKRWRIFLRNGDRKFYLVHKKHWEKDGGVVLSILDDKSRDTIWLFPDMLFAKRMEIVLAMGLLPSGVHPEQIAIEETTVRSSP